MRYPVAETAQADDQFQPLRCGGVGVVVALMSLEPFVDILVATGIARSRRSFASIYHAAQPDVGARGPRCGRIQRGRVEGVAANTVG